MHWHPEKREQTFLRFVRELARLMDIPAKDVCRPMAWHFWRDNRWSASTAFDFLARAPAPSSPHRDQ